MDDFRKPNFYGTCAGQNTGGDILGGSCDYQGTMEVILQDLDDDQFSQIDASKLLAPNAFLEKAEKKRKIDKAYRERCKMKKLQMRRDLETLGEENEDLQIENESLKEMNAFMTQMLQSQTEELNQLKNRLHNLKFENEKQNTLLQIFSDLVVNSPHLCHENQKLKDENAQLRKIVKLSDEPIKLVEENAKLQLENMLLIVQIDALCGKIVDENSKNCGKK
ncbi:hypothetical protein REPUB_Repub03eG0152500 [Reevesia pubescens]